LTVRLTGRLMAAFGKEVDRTVGWDGGCRNKDEAGRTRTSHHVNLNRANFEG